MLNCVKTDYEKAGTEKRKITKIPDSSENSNQKVFDQMPKSIAPTHRTVTRHLDI